MPFKSTRTFPSKPVVKIFFSGQLILHSPKDRNICEVCINRAAPDHVFSVEVRGKSDKRPDVILMRYFGQLSFLDLVGQPKRTHGLYIMLQGEGEAGVERYDGGEKEGASKLGDALNLVEMHDTLDPLPDFEIDPRGGRPSILIDGGVFYSALKTKRKFKLSKPKKGEDEERTNFASLLGAITERPVEIIWLQNGEQMNLRLSTEDKRFDRFEIYMTNDPLYENDEEDGEAGSLAHNEFDEYYKILPKVKSEEKCAFTPINETDRLDARAPDEPAATADSNFDDDRGSTRTPCTPVIIDPEG